MLCGTDPHPKDIRAKKYKVDKHFLTKEDFVHIMKNLPVPVDDEDIEEMFEFADKNKDGKLSYKEFKVLSITLYCHYSMYYSIYSIHNTTILCTLYII